MPKDEIENFRNAFDYYDAKDPILDSKEGSVVINYLCGLGYEILDTGKEWYKKAFTHRKESDELSENELKRPLPPKPLINNIQEEAMYGANTPLQEVTRPKLEEYSFPTNKMNVSFSVSDLHGIFNLKKGDERYSIGLGDKFSLGYQKQNFKTEIEHNIFNGKTRIDGSINTPTDSKYASVYHCKDGTIGAVAGYYNNKGYSVSFAADSNGDSAISAGCHFRSSDAHVEIQGFVATYNRGLNDYYNRNADCKAGVLFRITGL